MDEDGDMDFGDWTPVLHGKSRKKVSSQASHGNKRGLEGNSTDDDDRAVRRKVVTEEFKVILKFREEDARVYPSPMILSKEIKRKIGDVELAKVLRDGNLLLICRNEEMRHNIMHVDSICKKVVTERVVLGGKKVSRGVITGIPVDEDLDKLKRSIQGGDVTRLKRLTRMVNGERVDSLSVLIEFEGNNLPDKIKIGYLSFMVRPYVPPPLRCFKCQRFGHVAAVCRGKQRCLKCGGDHKIEDCAVTSKEKCCNCGGDHRVTYPGCETRKRAVAVQQIKTTQNISYAEAVKKLQSETPSSQTVTKVGYKKGEREECEDLTVEKLMLFIAYVINCTDQVKHRTEKIKIIVKGAEKFLGMKNGSWEQVNKRLELDGKGSTTGERTNC